jgi:iron complex outermembrane receptor protein
MLAAVLLLVLNITIDGRVRDAVTGDPMAGVWVQVIGTMNGTATTASGSFRVEAESPARLRFTRPGYVATELMVRADSTVDIRLVPAARSLEGVTVTALRGEGGASGAAPITHRMVERAELEKTYSGQEMPLLLTRTPSITSYADGGAYSNYTYLRLRGIDQTRVNFTLDGVPLGDGEDEAVYFSNFPDFANSIQSAQVQRGVGTSSQGTASYAGSVNFQSIALDRSPRAGELQIGRGSFDTNRGSVEWHSGSLGSRAAAYGRLSSQQTDGYRHHSGNRSTGAFLSGGYFGDRSSVKMTALTGVSRNQESYLASPLSAIERDPRHNPLIEAERDRFTHTLVSLAGTRLVGPLASVTATAYTVAAGGDYDVAIGDELWNFNLASRVSGGFMTWTQQRGRLSLSAGAHANSYYRNHWLHVRPDLRTRLYHNTGHKDDASAFAKASIDAGRITLFGDLQARRAWYRYVPDQQAGIEERRIHWTFLNPKVGATYRLDRAVSLYAFAGQNGREPTRNDMFAGFDNVDTTNADFVGPLSRVRPERVRDVEAGFTLQSPSLALGANLYLMTFHNEITPIGALSYLGLPLRKNVGSSNRRGVELDGTYRGISRVTLTANATISWNRIRSYTDDATGTTYRNVEPLLTPRFLSNQGVEVGIASDLTVQVEGRYVSRSFLANTGDTRFMTPAFHTMDAAVNWRVGDLTLLTQLRNLTNVRAYTGGYVTSETTGATVRAVPAYYLLAARNLMVTARIAF